MITVRVAGGPIWNLASDTIFIPARGNDDSHFTKSATSIYRFAIRALALSRGPCGWRIAGQDEDVAWPAHPLHATDPKPRRRQTNDGAATGWGLARTQGFHAYDAAICRGRLCGLLYRRRLVPELGWQRTGAVARTVYLTFMMISSHNGHRFDHW